MTFNVIAGNPPYNRGIDIDFAFKSFKLSKDYLLMITPAKWQTADENQKIQSDHTYGDFRKYIVPHISQVCFYPDCLDIFGISQADGITYYLVSKQQEFKECRVENRSNLQKLVNSVTTRSILNGETLWNIGNDILEKLGEYEKFKISNTLADRSKLYTVNINTQLADSRAASEAWDFENSCIKPEYIGKGGQLFTQAGQVGLLNKSRILVKDEETPVKVSKDLFSSDSLEECKSFLSWMYSKFTRFFILINISSLPILNDNTFKFVPAPAVLDDSGNKVPGKFDHIYTDSELYNTFGLSQEQIKIIEAIIKERKFNG